MKEGLRKVFIIIFAVFLAIFIIIGIGKLLEYYYIFKFGGESTVMCTLNPWFFVQIIITELIIILVIKLNFPTVFKEAMFTPKEELDEINGKINKLWLKMKQHKWKTIGIAFLLVALVNF